MRSSLMPVTAAVTALSAALAAVCVGAQTAGSLARESDGVPQSRLPWPAGERVWVTQDCADTCCQDHVGVNHYAWDFAGERPFTVVAPRAGTVVHAKFSSNQGGDALWVDYANYLVIDHGDGTYSVMLHLAYGSLDPAVQCGGFVRAGQRLAVTGDTGWASGNHLHYQVNAIPAGMDRTCECGADGMACAPDEAHWGLFWSSSQGSATRPVSFAEWPGASRCGDRHQDNLQLSRNLDAHEAVVTLDVHTARRESGGWMTVPGDPTGTFLSAPAGTGAQVFFPVAEHGVRPGVYTVWHAVPASVGSRTARGWAEVVGRGSRTRVEAHDPWPGGAFRPVAGRYKFTGRAGEGVRLGDRGRPGEVVTVDGLTLVRVADTGAVTEGGGCTQSTECTGDLVCVRGVCTAGCETLGCGEGARCDVTGLCVADAAGRYAGTLRTAFLEFHGVGPGAGAQSARR